MRRFIFTLTLFLAVFALQNVFAQPPNYSWDRFGQGTVTMANNSPATGIISNTTQASGSSTYYLVQWDSYWNKWSNTTTPYNQEFTLSWGGGSNNGPNGALSVATTGNRYYTLQINGLAYSNRQAVLMETDHAPQSFHATAATAVSTPALVNPGQAATINIALAGNKSSQEKVFVRYTKDNWSTSTVVEASGTGTTWSTASAVIPSADNAAGTTIKYYAYSTTVAATNSSSHDLIALKMATNVGANYTYTVASSWISTAAGNWTNSATWLGGIVPTSGQPVSIAHAVILDDNVTVSSLTINAGATFTASDASARILTITKSAAGSTTTLANSGVWANGTGGSTVVFTGAPGAGDAIHAVSGTSAFQHITVNKTSGSSNVGVSFGAGATVLGTMEIGSGGFVSSAPPSSFYDANAILKFNTGGVYNVGAGDYTWSTTQVPNNITISSGTVNLNANRTAVGDLLIDGGALVLVGAVTLTINHDWTRTSGSFTPGTGTVTLSGATSNIISTATSASLYNLIINKTGTVTLGNNLTITNALTLTSGALVINGQTLTLNGAVTGNGTLTGSTSSNLTIGAAAGTLKFTQTDAGTRTLKNFTLNNGASATLGSALEIAGGAAAGTVAVNTGATLTISNDLILQSNLLGTASVGPSAGTISGDVTVERYIGTSRRAWRLLTIPVTGPTIRAAWAGGAANPDAPTGETNNGSGTLITGHGIDNGAAAVAAGFDWFTGLGTGTTSSIRYYNAGWASVDHTPDVLAAPAKQGYMLFVRGDRTIIGTGSNMTTLKPKGGLNIGQKTVAINAAYEVVGNPYASAINLDAMYLNTGNAAKINPNFWVWDVTLGTSGGFRLLSGDGSSNYTMTPSGGTAADYLNVQSGQAFFVEKNGSASGVSINIEESNKITSSSTPVIFRTTSIDGPVGLLNVNLYKAAQLVDGTTVRFNDGYDRAATEEYDAVKLNNFNENLSVVRDNRYLSIESFPYPTNTDTVFLSFWNLAANNYSFRLNTVDLGGKLTSAILIDRFTAQQTALDLTGANTDYAFSVTSDAASSSLSRFIIVMKALVILPLNFTKVTATAKQTGIEVNWKTMSETGVRDFDVEKSADGLLFAKAFTTAASNNATGKNYGWLDAQPTEGWNYYRIRSNDLAGQKQYSSIVKALWKNTGLITVYPNLTTDGKVTISLKGLPAGDYGITLTGSNGEQVYKSNLLHTGGNNSYVFNLRGSGSLLASGVYVLSITDTKGTKTNFSIVLAN